jgi:hypothetical protein
MLHSQPFHPACHTLHLCPQRLAARSRLEIHRSSATISSFSALTKGIWCIRQSRLAHL